VENYFRKIEVGVGLDDAELISYQYEQSKNIGTVKIRTWNAKCIVIHFIGPILLIDRGCQAITAFGERSEQTVFFEEVLKKVYDSIPKNHPYKLYQLLDMDNTPSLEVVSEEIKLEIMNLVSS